MDVMIKFISSYFGNTIIVISGVCFVLITICIVIGEILKWLDNGGI